MKKQEVCIFQTGRTIFPVFLMCDNSIHCFTYHAADELGSLDYTPEVHTKSSYIKINEPIHFQRGLREKGLNIHSRWHYLFRLKVSPRKRRI